MHPKLIQLEEKFNHSILTKVNDPWLDSFGVELWLKRDDLLDLVISGNKWRKLKYILDHVLALNCHTIISMGGAYSNHLHALAYVGKKLGLKTAGLIRGEPQLTPTIADLQHWGMKVQFVSRTEYRQLRKYKHWQELPGLNTGEYWLTEGGALALALQGVTESVAEIKRPYDVICVPCGTGTTLAGVISAMTPKTQALGLAALKGDQFLTGDVEAMQTKPNGNWQINYDYCFGGFAKTNAELLNFMAQFTVQTGIQLEPVYTGKMLYGIYDLIQKRAFPCGTRIVALHTGGLQGNRGFKLEKNA